MISRRLSIKNIFIFIFVSTAFSIIIPGASYSSNFPFDEDAVFCSYFMKSGDIPSEQDIEEFCFSDNRPTYTSFKPSEMFSKKSIIKERSRIEKKIKSIDGTSTFLWRVRLRVWNNNEIDKSFSLKAINADMPQPTPYINSRISVKGPRFIKNALTSLVKARPELHRKKDIDIVIGLKPEKSEYGYQKRNIVEQDVILPIRYVIFQPTTVQILDELVKIQ